MADSMFFGSDNPNSIYNPNNAAGAADAGTEDDKVEFIKATLAKLTPEQTKEIHNILLQDPLLKDVPPAADSETVSR